MNRFNTIFDIITVVIVGVTSLLFVTDLYIDTTFSELSDELFYLTCSMICFSIFCVSTNKILKLNKICKNLISINKQLSDENKTLTAPPSAKVRVMPDGAVIKKTKGDNESEDIFFKFLRDMNFHPKSDKSE